MNGKKKVGFLVFFGLLLVVATGVFYFQSGVMKLNQSLPSQIKVTRGLRGSYKVTNRLDGYEFYIPDDWQGLSEIDYFSEDEREEYSVTSINIMDTELRTGAAIDLFKKIKSENASLLDVANSIFLKYGLSGEFKEDEINNQKIVMTREYLHLGGEYIYFFGQNSDVYAITSKSESAIKEIIIKGTW